MLPDEARVQCLDYVKGCQPCFESAMRGFGWVLVDVVADDVAGRGSPLRAPVAAPMKRSTALRQHARNPRAYLGTTCHAQSVLRQQAGSVSF
jgi:hypothetical protein